MPKALITLTIVIAGLSATTPASAHFSQVFGPMKAQIVSFAAAPSPARMMCEGSFVADIGSGWTSGRGD